MSLLTKCYSCTADILFPKGENTATCIYCGRINARPKSQASELTLMKFANELLSQGKFDLAAEIYRKVLELNLKEHEASWGLMRCTYGVIYVEDEGTHQRLPTCRRICAAPIALDGDYKRACSSAPAEVRADYERDGAYIENVQREIDDLYKNAAAYDIFLCYKETDPNGGCRTKDSELAEDLYSHLTGLGYNVFYAPVSLKDRIGANYEAAIFYAVNTSRVMLVLGTKPEYLNSTWVRSEWLRYLDRISAGENNLLIPLYQDFLHERLPDEFKAHRLQGLNMRTSDWRRVLVDRLAAFLPPPTPPVPPEPTRLEKLLKRGYDELRRGDFEAAMSCFNDALNEDYQSPYANIGMAMAKLNVRSETELANACAKNDDWLKDKYFQRAEENADDETKALFERIREERAREIRKTFDYKIGNDGVSILKYNGKASHVVIPDTIFDKPVIKIAYGAFDGCDFVEEITIPHRLRVIGSEAFKNCRKLKRLHHKSEPTLLEKLVPNWKQYIVGSLIPSLAFWGLGYTLYKHYKDKTLTMLPRELTHLGEDAFCGCTDMKMLYICRSTKAKNQNNPGLTIEYYD